MKKTFGIIALAALVMLAGCKKNEEQPTGSTKLIAGIEQQKSDSKTSLNPNDFTITWSEDDHLFVYNGATGADFTLSTGAGTTKAEFTGDCTFTDSNLAVYPYNDNITVEGNMVTMTLPAEQNATVDNFGNGANPMLGVFSDFNNLTLKSLCGVLCLQLTGDNVAITKIELVGGPDDKLNGTFEADYTADTSVLAKKGTDGTNKVTLNCTATLTATPQKFFVVLPAGTLHGFTMKVYNGDSEIFRKSTATNINFKANYVESMTETPVTPSNKYSTPLTFEARETVPVTVGVKNYDATISPLEFSINGGTWTLFNGSVTLENVGDIVQFRGNNACFRWKPFTCTQQCYIYGNVMSLLHKDDYATNYTFTDTYAFSQLFKDNTNIDLHPDKELVLPATTLFGYCYNNMFRSCAGLTRVPELPATTLANDCYSAMFRECTGLTSVPDTLLHATELAYGCYSGMFLGCTGLTTAPTLPAPTLPVNCYHDMFSGCTHLNSVTCLATDISASMCTEFWLQGVAATGTFTKASGVTWPTNSASGIPTGWTPVNYGAVLVENITLNKTATTITAGETETLSVASVLPATATDQTVTWSSDDTSVATVVATTGEVTAVAAGTATITATANDGSNVTATCVVTVNAPAPTVPEGIVNGLYSVSATKQVWFSKGNLQYQVPTGNWRFAEHQWDYCQTSIGAWNNSNWIDYFTWGTWTGSNPNPLQTSNIDESIYTFAATDFDQTLHGSDAWRTLTIEEWYYLFYERASGATVTTTSGTTNNARFAKATINTNVASVNGLILFPDGVTIASNEATTWGTINDIGNEWGTKCTSAQWTDLENKGCVFLPAAGDHHGDGNSPVTAFVVGTWGFYWSSSNKSAQAGYCVYFYEEDMRPKPTNTYYDSWHSTGMCVRLVQDYN